MGEAFDISVTEADDTVTLVLSGELDLSGVGTFDAALESIGSDVRSVIVDLAGLTFVDSSGIGSFVRAQAASRARNWDLLLRSPTALVRRVMDAIDLGASIEIAD